MNINIGETQKIFYQVVPATAQTDFTFTSCDETIATVDENGNVTGIGKGLGKILISATDGSAKKTVYVVVSDPSEASSIDVSTWYEENSWLSQKNYDSQRIFFGYDATKNYAVACDKEEYVNSGGTNIVPIEFNSLPYGGDSAILADIMNEGCIMFDLDSLKYNEDEGKYMGYNPPHRDDPEEWIDVLSESEDHYYGSIGFTTPYLNNDTASYINLFLDSSYKDILQARPDWNDICVEEGDDSKCYYCSVLIPSDIVYDQACSFEWINGNGNIYHTIDNKLIMIDSISFETTLCGEEYGICYDFTYADCLAAATAKEYQNIINENVWTYSFDNVKITHLDENLFAMEVYVCDTDGNPLEFDECPWIDAEIMITDADEEFESFAYTYDDFSSEFIENIETSGVDKDPKTIALVNEYLSELDGPFCPLEESSLALAFRDNKVFYSYLMNLEELSPVISDEFIIRTFIEDEYGVPTTTEGTYMAQGVIINVPYKELDIEIGECVSLEAHLTDPDNIAFSGCSEKNIIYFDEENLKLYGLKEGTTKVTLTTFDDYGSHDMTFIVNVHANEIKMDDVILETKETIVTAPKLANVSQFYTDDEIILVSNDELVEVDKENRKSLTAGSSAGVGTVNAVLDDFITTASVAVVDIDAGVPESVKLGDTDTIETIVGPEAISVDSITYESSDEDVVTVDSEGNITPVVEGTANITTTVNLSYGTATKAIVKVETIEILPDTVLVNNIAVAEDELEVYAGETVEIEITDIAPVDAEDKDVTFESSDPETATVDEFGIVTGVKAGTVTITITAVDESGTTAEVTVTVKEHIAGAPVRENETHATCQAEGSYDEVIYCAEPGCTQELSRTHKIVAKLPHTDANNDCYCDVCNALIPGAGGALVIADGDHFRYQISTDGVNFKTYGNETFNCPGGIAYIRVANSNYKVLVNGTEPSKNANGDYVIVVDGGMVVTVVNSTVPDKEQTLTFAQKIANFFQKIIEFFRNIFK